MVLHQECQRALEKDAELEKLLALPVRERIARCKYTSEQELNVFDEIQEEIKAQVAAVTAAGGEEVA